MAACTATAAGDAIGRAVVDGVLAIASCPQRIAVPACVTRAAVGAHSVVARSTSKARIT